MTKSTVIRIRLDDELLQTIRQLAQANDRTIAKQIQFTIKQTIKETK
jgi:predicted transcriptional regulator